MSDDLSGYCSKDEEVKYKGCLIECFCNWLLK